jgi:hypothetical protein
VDTSPASQNDNRQENPAPKALPASSLQEEALVAAREAALSKQYKIHFSHPGESVEGEVSFDELGKVHHGPMIYARAPKLAELEALQNVLERSRPSQLMPDNNGDGIKFYFLPRPLQKDGEDVVATHVNADKTGRPAIYMGVDGAADAHVVLHELGHNTQTRLGWQDQKRFMTYSRALGFEPFVSPSGESIFALRDKQGGLHRVEPDSLDWLAIDEQGHYLDKAGQPCPDNNKATAARLDPGQMREAALIRPATYYFSNPLEMAAEALALFREGPEQRRQLLKDSPGLYRFTKNQDQKDINEAYGLSKSGQALYLRLPSGHLAMSTKGRLDEIEKFEN